MWCLPVLQPRQGAFMLFFIFCEKNKSQPQSGRYFEDVLKIDLIWRPLHNTWHAVWMCLFSFSLFSRWNCLFLSFQFFCGSLGTHTKINTGAAGIQCFNNGFRSYKSERKNASHKSSTCHRGGSIQGLVSPFQYLTKWEMSQSPLLFLSYCGNDQRDVCAFWCHTVADFWTLLLTTKV